MSDNKILAVPTNVITGFLGVGKTSVIMHLLKQKPENERWAILVNEFGEIGVDGSLITGRSLTDKNIFIKEVSGGCMCCASGVPMQIALNQLLKAAKPHRLLIEPTGLGHPHEVLEMLSNQYYQAILKVGKTVTLVDARNLTDQRYTEHETFNQQLEIGDVIIGNKADLYQEHDKKTLKEYLSNKGFTPDKLYFSEHGSVQLAWLAEKTHRRDSVANNSSHHHHHVSKDHSSVNQDIPEVGFIKAVNQGEGYQSIGWRFAANNIFNRTKLISLLSDIKAIRVKAVFITADGIYGYNNTNDDFHEIKLSAAGESCIEIICDTIDDSWEARLQQALIKHFQQQ